MWDARLVTGDWTYLQSLVDWRSECEVFHQSKLPPKGEGLTGSRTRRGARDAGRDECLEQFTAGEGRQSRQHICL